MSENENSDHIPEEYLESIFKRAGLSSLNPKLTIEQLKSGKKGKSRFSIYTDLERIRNQEIERIFTRKYFHLTNPNYRDLRKYFDLLYFEGIIEEEYIDGHPYLNWKESKSSLHFFFQCMLVNKNEWNQIEKYFLIKGQKVTDLRSISATEKPPLPWRNGKKLHNIFPWYDTLEINEKIHSAE